MRWLLDTNIINELIAGRGTARYPQLPFVVQCISSITYGELLHGVHNSSRLEAELAKLNLTLERVEILPVDHRVAEQYGFIRTHLRKAGTPLPDNDIWIAATAIAHDLPLLSLDVDFQRIPNLQLLA